MWTPLWFGTHLGLAAMFAAGRCAVNGGGATSRRVVRVPPGSGRTPGHAQLRIVEATRGRFGPRVGWVYDHWPSWCLIIASTCFLTASRLNEAGSCIGGNSIAVSASFATYCWTSTKRQNSRA